MKLNRNAVEHIANLARLDLSEEEKDRFAGQLSDILDYAARLEEVDTSQIPPTARVLKTPLRLRQDVPRPGLPREDLLHNAAETDANQFKVPPVFGGQDG